jgi:hypothetical protein
LVLFAKLDKDSAKKATDALGKVEGVSGKETKADAAKGEISIRLDGKGKLTSAKLIDALKKEGIEATIAKEKGKKKD